MTEKDTRRLRGEGRHETVWSTHRRLCGLTKLTLARSPKPAKPVKGKAYGKLTIRGVTRDVVADVTATSFPLTDALRNPDFGFTGDLMKIDVAFKTSFTNHGMQVPQMLFYKVSNDIDVQTSLTLVAQPAQTSN